MLVCGVEIGVRRDLLRHILKYWRGRHLTRSSLARDRRRATATSPTCRRTCTRAIYQQAQKNSHRSASAAPSGRMTSLEAAVRIPRYSLDFVYIDARHDYPRCGGSRRLVRQGASRRHDRRPRLSRRSLRAGGVRCHSRRSTNFCSRDNTRLSTLLDGRSCPGWPRPPGRPMPPTSPVSDRLRRLTAPDSPFAIPLMPRTPLSVNLTTALGSTRLAFELDPAHMSQRFILEELTAGRLYESETSNFVGASQPGVASRRSARMSATPLLSSVLVGPPGGGVRAQRVEPAHLLITALNQAPMSSNVRGRYRVAHVPTSLIRT